MGTATRIVNYLFGFRIIETFHTPMGTATVSSAAVVQATGNISYPYGDSNVLAEKHILNRARNISYPYGDSNPSVLRRYACSLRKHFIPLWGQLPVVHQLGHRVVAETFHTPMGTVTGSTATLLWFCMETFHTPTGTATAKNFLCILVHNETFHTSMGTATVNSHVEIFAKCCRNILYPYGDSNSLPWLR